MLLWWCCPEEEEEDDMEAPWKKNIFILFTSWSDLNLADDVDVDVVDDDGVPAAAAAAAAASCWVLGSLAGGAGGDAGTGRPPG